MSHSVMVDMAGAAAEKSSLAAPDIDDRKFRALCVRHRDLLKMQVHKISRMQVTTMQRDELLQMARIGLWQAAQSFDASKVTEGQDLDDAFAKYAIKRIRGAMLDEMRQQDHLSRRDRRDVRRLQADARAVKAKPVPASIPLPEASKTLSRMVGIAARKEGDEAEIGTETIATYAQDLESDALNQECGGIETAADGELSERRRRDLEMLMNVTDIFVDVAEVDDIWSTENDAVERDVDGRRMMAEAQRLAASMGEQYADLLKCWLTDEEISPLAVKWNLPVARVCRMKSELVHKLPALIERQQRRRVAQRLNERIKEVAQANPGLLPRTQIAGVALDSQGRLIVHSNAKWG